jgi:hypothetical protein
LAIVSKYLLDQQWVACTLPERAFVRVFLSQIYLFVEITSASSALPYRRAPPTWLKTTPDDVVEHITKLARKGLTPSQIGVVLRDSHGIPQVRFVTGNKILRILKSQGALSPGRSSAAYSPFSLVLFPSLLGACCVICVGYLFVWG